MRIAHIGQKGIPATFGGIEYHVDHVSRRQARRGHDVRVYVRDWYTPKGLTDYEGVRLIHVPTIRTKHLDATVHTFLSTLHCLFQKTDIIHYHAIGPSAFAFIPRLFGRRTVTTVHRLDWGAEKWGAAAKFLLKCGEWLGLRTARQAIAVSADIRTYIESVHGRKAFLIPNGVDIRRPRPPALIKDKYGLQGQDFVLFMGRLTPEKRVHWLIRSFLEVKKAVSPARGLKLVISGGTSATAAYVEELHGLGRGDPGILFTGYVTGQEKEELLTNALLFVLPSSLEGYPIALLEAKSFGSGALASDIPPHREVIRDGVDGFLFKSGEPDDLTDKLRRLVTNPALVEQAGRASREAMRGRPSWDEVLDKILEAYASAMS